MTKIEKPPTGLSQHHLLRRAKRCWISHNVNKPVNEYGLRTFRTSWEGKNNRRDRGRLRGRLPANLLRRVMRLRSNL